MSGPALPLPDGFHSYAIIDAAPVDADAVGVYDRWLALGRNATMAFATRYRDVRDDPRLLLTDTNPDARVASLIIFLFPYPSTPADTPVPNPHIAEYALGADYHYALKQQLQPLVDYLADTYSAVSRICVDSAPLRERYWAQRAGLGIVTRNNYLTVPGLGAHFLIATVATTARLPERPGPVAAADICKNCDICLRACPTQALQTDGSCDTARCLSYLSIEAPRPAADPIFGCDICRRACPHHHPEKNTATVLPAFTPSEIQLSLTPATFAALTPTARRRLLRATPLTRRR